MQVHHPNIQPGTKIEAVIHNTETITGTVTHAGIHKGRTCYDLTGCVSSIHGNTTPERFVYSNQITRVIQ